MPAVFQVEGGDPVALAAGLREIIARLRLGSPDVIEKEAASRKWRHEHSYDVLAARLAGLIESLHSDPDRDKNLFLN